MSYYLAHAGNKLQKMTVAGVVSDITLPSGVTVSTTKRSPAFADVPTMQEAGVPDFEVDSWYAMLVPAKTPRAVIDKLNKALNTVLAEPAIRAQLLDQGADAVGGTPEALAKTIAAEVPKWIKLAKDANIKAD